MNLEEIKQKLEPYRGVLRFALVLIVVHFAWKFTIVGDERGNEVSWFGCDISAPFAWMSAHLASLVHGILSGCGYYVVLTNDTILRFANWHSVGIVWACTGIKQMVIFSCILLASRGPWLQKLWFVPMGIAVCYVVNLARLTLLALVVYYCPDWFDVLHEHVSKYLFYAIIFLLWVWWEEKFASHKSK